MLWSLLYCLGIVTGLLGCNTQTDGMTAASATNPSTKAGRLKVVCTTGMVADLARQVGGDLVEVAALMGPGVDPHLYKASPNDVRLLHGADLVLYSGLHLEGKLTSVLESLASKRSCVAVTRSLPQDKLLSPTEGFPDPHVWFDVELWANTVSVVEAELIQQLPTAEAELKQRAEKYRQELAALHQECQKKLAQIPQAARILVTAHDAFEYFGRAYALQVKAIQGINTESEAGVKEINELVDFLVQHKIQAVFIESSLNDRNIRSLVEGCQQAGHAVEIGGELYSDALGPAGSSAETYVGMIRTNVATLLNALRPETSSP